MTKELFRAMYRSVGDLFFLNVCGFPIQRYVTKDGATVYEAATDRCGIKIYTAAL